MKDLEKSIHEEKELFNSINNKREISEFIPVEFDYDLVPENFDFDRYAIKKIGQKSINFLVDTLKSLDHPLLVDVCCGPGWVSLLSATRGANVYGYDITEVGLRNANLSKERNKDNISKMGGSLEYFNQNVHTIPFLNKQNMVDFYIGWSAFHHLDKLDDFFDRMNYSLKSGGYIISVDDIGSHKINRIFTWFFKFILPLKNISYIQKFKNIFKYILKIFQPEKEWHTPMEEFVGKHENAVEKIELILKRDYLIVSNYRYCAFIHYFILDIAGPIWFKKIIFSILWSFDKFLIATKICKGNLRFILAKKINN
jgi:SAM-dependent methyltransferase